MSSTSSTTTTTTTSLERAQEWCRWDPNPVTAQQLQAMIDDDKDDSTKIAALFPDNDRIAFGTAGLRAAMDLGPMHMNDVVILQTAQGIAKYCQSLNTENKTIKIVIGYDHRARHESQLSSLNFAILSAMVFLEAGIECILLDGFVPTPLLAYSTAKLGAMAGIMVTASHNPKQDAGYKVYWSSTSTSTSTSSNNNKTAACQIRPPIDTGIATCIQENLVPWTDYGVLRQERLDQHPNDATLGLSNVDLTATVRAQYMEAIRTSGLVYQSPTTSNNNAPKFCYTAMHGVGHDYCVQVFSEVFKLPPFVSVPQQQEPDADFTTVVFPNPEEDGALDLAKAHAEQHGATVVLANDPDADRLAVAEYNDKQTWTVFTGDQIGALLGSWMWEIMGKNSDTPVAMCASTVSSRLLAEMARVEGFHFEDTLTGFKWIGSRAAALDASGDYRSIFCYEEAIGFCCGNVIFDKDGISAMGVFAQLTCHVYQELGISLVERLQQLYDKYGEFVSHNGYYFYTDASLVANIFTSIRNDGKYMKTVGPYAVAAIRDLGDPGYDSTKPPPDYKPTLPTSKSSPMITITFENGCVVQFRASGTEPKFKYYMELKGAPGVARAVVEEDMKIMSSLILQELVRPEEHGLSTTR